MLKPTQNQQQVHYPVEKTHVLGLNETWAYPQRVANSRVLLVLALRARVVV